MVNFFGFNFFTDTKKIIPAVTLDQLPSAYAGQTSSTPYQHSIYDGEKFPGGYGATQLLTLDYWSLRQKSDELFKTNLYARGFIKRLITNEINTGLTPEAFPDNKIIGIDDDLSDWTEYAENRFNIWGKNPEICDFMGKHTFGKMQVIARMEALISGDLLVVLRPSDETKRPKVQLISGTRVRTPYGSEYNLAKGHIIKHGVEFDKLGRVFAHWVQKDEGSFERILAKGKISGRKTSWLIYGADKRLDDIRGQPILSLVLQSLKEVDRYRDSAQRKATINSILAMFIKKTSDKMGTLPLSNGVVRHDDASQDDGSGQSRAYNMASQIPGLILEELQVGEEPVGFNNNGTDVNFGEFEKSIIQAIAWSNEIPPEILMLSFSSNYSASQAAINEFRVYLNKVWFEWGDDFCNPIYVEWLLSEVLLRKIDAPKLLESWRDPMKADVYGAWTSVNWYGSIKPSTDPVKTIKASEKLLANGLTTHAREARIITGTKFSKNMKRLAEENKLLVNAMQPLVEMREQIKQSMQSSGAVSLAEDTICEMIEDQLQENGINL